MGFSNVQLKSESFPKIDDVDLKPISKQYLKIISINKLAMCLGVVSVLLLGKFFIQKNSFHHIFWPLFVTVSAFCIINTSIAILAFKKRKYALREHDVIYGHGLIINSVVTVPISRIQHIEESRSWLARQFGLTTLNIFTAGESGSDLSIKGLLHSEAKQIKDFISEKINAAD